MQFVQNGVNCKIIFIGDVAQLPPVGLLVSPALDVKYMESHFFGQKIDTITLREVVRQQKDSGILANATNLRSNLENKIKQISIQLYPDVKKIIGNELEDALNEAYRQYGRDGCIFITRSNKRAYQYNQEVRNRLLGREEEISPGDYLMVVKNNYHWLPPESEAGFIANGDMIELLKIKNIDAMHGFRFGDATFRMMDYPDQPPIEGKVILDTIASESPSLTFEQSNELYQAVAQQYKDIPLKIERNKKIKEDPFYNALQIKFGYAVTCHKAQGGQWPAVFVDQGYLTDEMVNTEYLRWLYTAFTRASQKLYLVNFSEQFFKSAP
jgi:exodeoxyribonuclease-5